MFNKLLEKGELRYTFTDKRKQYYIQNGGSLATVVSHIYAYDRAKTLSFILLIRRKSTEFENESNV